MLIAVLEELVAITLTERLSSPSGTLSIRTYRDLRRLRAARSCTGKSADPRTDKFELGGLAFDRSDVTGSRCDHYWSEPARDRIRARSSAPKAIRLSLLSCACNSTAKTFVP